MLFIIYLDCKEFDNYVFYLYLYTILVIITASNFVNWLCCLLLYYTIYLSRPSVYVSVSVYICLSIALTYLVTSFAKLTCVQTCSFAH